MSFEGSIFSINKQIFTDGDMSGNLQSAILDVSEVTGYAIHATWTGDPDGSLIISGSDTENIDDFVPVDTQATAGEAGAHLLNVEKCHYKYVLVQYEASAGSGDLNCKMSAKRI